MAKKNRKKKKNSLRLKLVRFVIGLSLITAVFAFLFFFLVKWGAFGPLPSQDDLQNLQSEKASLVYSIDEKLLGKIFAVNRSHSDLEELPNYVLDALVATEDVRFYQHHGVDFRSLGRVLVKTLILQDESSGGGSTITQQLAKNLYGRRNFSFLTLPVNKVKEIILAWQLEDIYSKGEILEIYLNTVSFSENTYGLKAGAQRFFSKNPEKLKLEEAAILIGLLKANTYYNPRLNPEHAKLRRNVVLSQMEKYNFITPAQADSLQSLELKLQYQNLEQEGMASYFLKQVESRAGQILKEIYKADGTAYNLQQDGLTIKTTLHSKVQKAVQQSLEGHLALLQNHFDERWPIQRFIDEHAQLVRSTLESSAEFKRLKAKKHSKDSLEIWIKENQPRQVYHPSGEKVLDLDLLELTAYRLKLLQAASVALHPQTGAIRAWVGGRSYRWMPYDNVLAHRQAASTFKPIVFAAALEQGQDPCDYKQAERRIYEQYKDWAPRNYDADYEGLYSMQGALKKSVNTVTVKTLLEVGVDEVLHLAEDLGISTQLPRNPSLALGSGAVNLRDLSRAYSVFANGGQSVDSYFIEEIRNANGAVIYRHSKVVAAPVISEETAALMTAMLQEVVNDGTAQKLRKHYGLQNDLAGKTGTAQNYADGWFVGYNPQLAMGVWVGGRNPAIHFESGAWGSGSAMALPVFGEAWQKMNREPELQPMVNAEFPSLKPEWKNRLDCPDFRDENLLDKVKGIFKKEPGDEFEEEDKPGFFQRLFGRDKSKV